MVAMPIRTTKIPSALIGQPNGSIPERLLGMVDREAAVWQMAELPARGMRALHAAVFAEFGVRLSSTGRGRSFSLQFTTFLQRHDPVSASVYATLPTSGAKRRYWPDAVSRHGLPSVYWRLKPGMAAAAVPGTSPHGMWCADDICLPGNVGITARPDILNWLYSNEMRFGFAHSLQSEPWHLQWFVADLVPSAVLDYEGVRPTPVTPESPAIPAPTPTRPAPTMNGDLMVIIFAIRGAHARFIGMATRNSVGNIIAVSARWVKTQAVLDAHLNAGAQQLDFDLADLQNVFLDGEMPYGDVIDWTPARFAA